LNTNVILQGDCIEMLRALPDNSVNTCVTSPPYWGLRDYGIDGQIGLEETPEAFVERLVTVFREVRRVLRDDGTLWLNLGDSYATDVKGDKRTPEELAESSRLTSVTKENQIYKAHGKTRRFKHGLKPKDLVGIPWRVAFALQADGWYLRSDIIWHKPNAMPESVRDRPTKAHEYIFLLTKSDRYYYNHESAKEDAVSTHPSGNGFKRPQRLSYGGRGNDEQWHPTEKRNRRTVWTISTKPFKGAHFATFPSDLIEPCILAGCPEGGVVLDPFFGAGTTGLVARRHNRQYVGIELNPEYIEIAKTRIGDAFTPANNEFSETKSEVSANGRS
jgi:DNA modification methylase